MRYGSECWAVKKKVRKLNSAEIDKDKVTPQ